MHTKNFSEPKLVHGTKRILGEWKFFAPKVVSESRRVLHGDYSFCTAECKTHGLMISDFPGLCFLF